LCPYLFFTSSIFIERGMALMKKMLDQSKIDDLITSIGFSKPGSNSGYRAEQVIKSF
jgi:hypothetical protein